MSVNLSQFPSQSNFFNYTYEASKKYCVLKYTQEMELNRFKNTLEYDLKQLMQDLTEEGLSSRKINGSRVMYEKSLETGYTNPNDKKPSNSDKARRIIQFINDEFGIGNASDHFRLKYYHADELLMSYYTKYYDVQDELSKFKHNQRIRLNELRNEIMDNGIPIHVLNYTYKRLKADLGIIKQGFAASELDHADLVYNTIKDDLIQELRNV